MYTSEPHTLLTVVNNKRAFSSRPGLCPEPEPRYSISTAASSTGEGCRRPAAPLSPAAAGALVHVETERPARQHPASGTGHCYCGRIASPDRVTRSRPLVLLNKLRPTGLKLKFKMNFKWCLICALAPATLVINDSFLILAPHHQLLLSHSHSTCLNSFLKTCLGFYWVCNCYHKPHPYGEDCFPLLPSGSSEKTDNKISIAFVHYLYSG